MCGAWAAPTGLDPHARFNDPSKLRYNHSAAIRDGIARAEAETSRYLADVR